MTFINDKWSVALGACKITAWCGTYGLEKTYSYGNPITCEYRCGVSAAAFRWASKWAVGLVYKRGRQLCTQGWLFCYIYQVRYTSLCCSATCSPHRHLSDLQARTHPHAPEHQALRCQPSAASAVSAPRRSDRQAPTPHLNTPPIGPTSLSENRKATQESSGPLPARHPLPSCLHLPPTSEATTPLSSKAQRTTAKAPLKYLAALQTTARRITTSSMYQLTQS